MLTLAGNIFGCILWGILIAVILTLICMLIAKGVTNKGCNLLLSALLFIPLCYQSALGVGSLYARGYVDDIHGYITSLTSLVPENASGEEISRILADQFPGIPRSILEKTSALKGTATTITQIADMVADSYRASLNSYLWQRIAWAFGFMVVGTVLLIMFPSSPARGRRCGSYGAVPARDRYNLDL